MKSIKQGKHQCCCNRSFNQAFSNKPCNALIDTWNVKNPCLDTSKKNLENTGFISADLGV